MLRGKGIPTRCSVLSGNPAPAIVNHIQVMQSAMVAIATHGWFGSGRLPAGSVAGMVIRSLDTPVLVVPPIQRSGEAPLSLAHQDRQAGRLVHHSAEGRTSNSIQVGSEVSGFPMTMGLVGRPGVSVVIRQST